MKGTASDNSLLTWRIAMRVCRKLPVNWKYRVISYSKFYRRWKPRMRARKPSTPAIADITDPTLKDVFRWIRVMDGHIYKLDDDILFIGKELSPFTGDRLQRLEERVSAMETKLENLTNTFITLVKRLNTIIDIKSRADAA